MEDQTSLYIAESWKSARDLLEQRIKIDHATVDHTLEVHALCLEASHGALPAVYGSPWLPRSSIQGRYTAEAHTIQVFSFDPIACGAVPVACMKCQAHMPHLHAGILPNLCIKILDLVDPIFALPHAYKCSGCGKEMPSTDKAILDAVPQYRAPGVLFHDTHGHAMFGVTWALMELAMHCADSDMEGLVRSFLDSMGYLGKESMAHVWEAMKSQPSFCAVTSDKAAALNRKLAKFPDYVESVGSVWLPDTLILSSISNPFVHGYLIWDPCILSPSSVICSQCGCKPCRLDLPVVVVAHDLESSCLIVTPQYHCCKRTFNGLSLDVMA